MISPHFKKHAKNIGKKKEYSRSPFIEEHCCPAVDEARLPAEPQDHQQDEDDEHGPLSKPHAAQLLVLLPHHLVRLLVSVVVHTAAK